MEVGAQLCIGGLQRMDKQSQSVKESMLRWETMVKVLKECMEVNIRKNSTF